VVSVELADTDLRTTYEPVDASVREGDEVEAGEVVGVVEPTGSHCPTACVHWGLLRGDTYLDPLSLLPPWLLHRGPSRLLPVLGVPLPR
jgi:murein DD-endopeptidase MepM/ murein hydrolase activator NlpD